MPPSLASRRASGEAKTRLVPCPVARTPSPPPSPPWGEGARGRAGGGGALSSFAEDAGAGAAPCWAAPSPRGGEDGDEGAPALADFFAPAAAAFPSSPS